MITDKNEENNGIAERKEIPLISRKLASDINQANFEAEQKYVPVTEEQAKALAQNSHKKNIELKRFLNINK
jgi:hypothetical protein